jgi:hypothetical protein
MIFRKVKKFMSGNFLEMLLIATALSPACPKKPQRYSVCAGVRCLGMAPEGLGPH